jgi:hypothetical protein
MLELEKCFMPKESCRDKRPGGILLHKVKDTSAKSLIPAVRESVNANIKVQTGGWDGYNGLSSNGYHHTVIRNTADVGENLLPLANRVVALLKRWLQGTHEGSPRPSHLDYHLDEFVF